MPDYKRIQQKIVTKSKLILQQQIMRFSFSDSRKILNRGVNGDNTFDLLARLDKDVFAHQPNGIILMVGTNDSLNGGNLVPIDQYKKNLLELTKTIKNKGLFLLLLTPTMVDDDVAAFPNKLNKSCSEILTDFRLKVIEVATETQTAYLDLFELFKQKGDLKAFLMNQKNSGRNDGVHPTAKGYTFIANAICEKLKEVNAPLDKLVCFGDSITFGYLVQGEGLETGESYPAVLNQLL